MLFDQLGLLRAGDVLVLDRGYPVTTAGATAAPAGIDFIIRCDSTHSWKAARELLRGAERPLGVLVTNAGLIWQPPPLTR